MIASVCVPLVCGKVSRIPRSVRSSCCLQQPIETAQPTRLGVNIAIRKCSNQLNSLRVFATRLFVSDWIGTAGKSPQLRECLRQVTAGVYEAENLDRFCLRIIDQHVTEPGKRPEAVWLGEIRRRSAAVLRMLSQPACGGFQCKAQSLLGAAWSMLRSTCAISRRACCEKRAVRLKPSGLPYRL